MTPGLFPCQPLRKLALMNGVSLPPIPALTLTAGLVLLLMPPAWGQNGGGGTSKEKIEPPTVVDPALKVDLFASDPLLRTPIGLTFTQDGKLLVIESNTHFRPPGYQGPEHDRILWMEDADKDGKAEKANVFFEGTSMTMDLATAPDGSVYVATRNEILRLRDADGDGKAEQVDRKLVSLETEGNYPHNGLGGLAFDGNGGLYFGLGENLGAAYTLTGSDGSKHSDQGEGGNIFHATTEGGKLRRIATGFWNPFGVCVDSWGDVFATDNDPDSRPPCRLHHVIEGGDYGYQFRYGRSGLHPFISWNGELPGTLPMLAATGEAPCDITFYAPDATKGFRGLTAPWHGSLLVASWVDHTIEAYSLPDTAHAYLPAEKRVLVHGGNDFRPVAFATAPDGSLYVSDWVKRDYELHGKGRIWRISAKKATDLKGPLAVKSGIAWKQEQLDKILKKEKVTALEAAEWLNDPNPWTFSAAITRLAREQDLLWILKDNKLPYPRQRQGLLLALSRDAQRTGAEPLLLPKEFLTDTDPTVRLLALKWVSDNRMADYKADVEKLLTDPELTPALFYAGITALGRLESEQIQEADLIKRLKARLSDAQTPYRLKRAALEILPDREHQLLAADLASLLNEGDGAFQEFVTQIIGSLRDNNREGLLRQVAFDPKKSPEARSAALMRMTLNEEDKKALGILNMDSDPIMKRAKELAMSDAPLPPPPAGRPPLTDIPAWEKYLAAVPGKPDLAQGREVFFHPKLGGCILCHRIDGVGSPAGPNLSTIGAAKSPDYILESLLQPSRNVPPQYESYNLTTSDGKASTAFQLMERGNVHTYIGLDGRPFDVKIEEITKREHLPVSIMPEGMVARLSDVQIRDLVEYLKSKK
jgi:putative membrane-bound dehydrogenase-like protein